MLEAWMICAAASDVPSFLAPPPRIGHAHLPTPALHPVPR
jgi:hypothetical protein